MYYIKCFFIYSFIGFIFETILALVMGHSPNSGILYGPFTPVYGIGVIFIIIISKYITALNLKRWQEATLLFFTLAFVLTILELVGGLLIEKLFDIVFWDYSNLPFSFGHYVSLVISVAWGFTSLMIVYIIKPQTDKIMKYIPNYIIYPLIVIFLTDLILTVIIL